MEPGSGGLRVWLNSCDKVARGPSITGTVGGSGGSGQGGR